MGLGVLRARERMVRDRITRLNERQTYTADDGIMACEMGLAVLAAEDFVGVEVDVVGEAHGGLLILRVLS